MAGPVTPARTDGYRRGMRGLFWYVTLPTMAAATTLGVILLQAPLYEPPAGHAPAVQGGTVLSDVPLPVPSIDSYTVTSARQSHPTGVPVPAATRAARTAPRAAQRIPAPVRTTATVRPTPTTAPTPTPSPTRTPTSTCLLGLCIPLGGELP